MTQLAYVRKRRPGLYLSSTYTMWIRQ